MQTEPKLAVILLFHSRFNVLREALISLDNQKYKHFQLFVVNNNYEGRAEVERIVGEMSSCGDISKDFLNRMEVRHNKTNGYGWTRFDVASTLTERFERFLFMDDDLILSNDVIERFTQSHLHGEVSGWWGFRLTDEYSLSKKIKAKHREPCDYLGTTCMMMDSYTVKKYAHIMKFTCPAKYKTWEDIWTSYFLTKMGEHLCAVDVNIKMFGDDHLAQHLTHNKGLDDKFIEELRKDGGWKMLFEMYPNMFYVNRDKEEIAKWKPIED